MANNHSKYYSSDEEDDEYLAGLVKSASAVLRGESVDENLVSVLRQAGADECWHKHGSFLDHLLGVHRILTMWNAPSPVRLCGLFHSAYSNSYVNLAIFPPSKNGREIVLSHVGPAAESLIHLFCVVPRQHLIHDLIMSRYSDDAELVRHLSGIDDSWRAKVQSVCPAEGVKVKHIRTGEDVVVPRRVVAVFLLLTMADFSDQLFGFQDVLFDNADGRLDFSGNNAGTCLWPGEGKPGLWLNYVSRMGAIYRLIVREEEMATANNSTCTDDLPDLELVIPPVFNWCKAVVESGDQVKARDLYWEAVCGGRAGQVEEEEKLLESVEKNPFVGEPLLVLGQMYLGKGDFEAGEKAVRRGLRLMLEWGSPWDKRMTWQGWVAWGRVLLNKAKDRSWPQNGWGILNLGLVT
ncbi:Unknown protein [Striga hermonthica]|uniref:DUF6817 domain-containing protein n=1 Tax=Striga hermonthica TaxID=68872 RepID=A0A9N7MV29_STRHE|nr:Unknown protein [Striga hermonthica]